MNKEEKNKKEQKKHNHSLTKHKRNTTQKEHRKSKAKKKKSHRIGKCGTKTKKTLQEGKGTTDGLTRGTMSSFNEDQLRDKLNRLSPTMQSIQSLFIIDASLYPAPLHVPSPNLHVF